MAEGPGRPGDAAPLHPGHRGGAPADDGPGRAVRPGLQRRGVQPPGAARGAARPRHRLPHPLRHRGGPGRSVPLGRRGAGPPQRDVRPGPVGPWGGDAAPGPRRGGHQAPLLPARPAAPRLGLGAAGDRRLPRRLLRGGPGGARPVPGAGVRPDAPGDAARRPEAGARELAGGLGGRGAARHLLARALPPARCGRRRAGPRGGLPPPPGRGRPPATGRRRARRGVPVGRDRLQRPGRRRRAPGGGAGAHLLRRLP